MTTKANNRQAAKRLTIWTLIVLQTLPLQSWAATALLADPSATVKPVLNVSGNGVPIVQIVPPNAGGVSHNKFTQYNVGTEGQILNNSGLGSASALAGSVGGNPMLGNSNARLILNEVTSANPSALNGLIEITGNRADLVIANPNGISVDGAGFINASRATLTTGKPQFASDGNLARFNVEQGQISILGKGLDARGADQLQLLSRSLVVNAKLQANWLDIATGANQIDANTGGITPQVGTGAAPAVAVDVGSLGSMYANSIYLVGTEAGVGVNSRGKIEALLGDIQLSSAGDLTIVDGQLKAAWDVRADAARDITVQGSDIQAGGDVELVASRHLNVTATDNSTTGSTASGSTTTTTATTRWTGSVIEAGGDVTLVANSGTDQARLEAEIAATEAEIAALEPSYNAIQNLLNGEYGDYWRSMSWAIDYWNANYINPYNNAKAALAAARTYLTDLIAHQAPMTAPELASYQSDKTALTTALANAQAQADALRATWEGWNSWIEWAKTYNLWESWQQNPDLMNAINSGMQPYETALLTVVTQREKLDSLIARHDGGKITVSASAIRANGNALLAGSNVSVESKVDSKLVRNVTYYKKCKWYGSCKSSTTINQSLEETLVGGEVSAAGDVTALALGNRDNRGDLIPETGDLLLLGAAIGSDIGAVQLTAVNDLEVEAAQTRHSNSSEVYVKKSGILSTTKTTNIDRSQNLIAEGSLVTGDTVQLQSGRDIMVRGGTISADNDISLVAGRDVDVIEARDFESRDTIRIKKKSGLFGSGLFGITLGTTSTTQITEEDLDTASASQIASIGGGVSILGGNDVLLQGADLLAGTDIDIIGNNVGILAAKNIYDRKDIYKTRTSGLTLALKGGVISALESAWQSAQRANGAEDDRLQAAYAMKAGYHFYDAFVKDGGQAFSHLIQGDIASINTGVNLELSLGTNSAQSINTQHDVTYRASNLDANGDLTVIARMPETGQTGGVIDIMGSNLAAYDQTLSAGKLLSVRYAPQTSVSTEKSNNIAASIGVGIGTSGLYFTASGQVGTARGEAIREDNGESRLIADNTLTLLSGDDATFKGAIATANRIEADIAGDLTLSSLQDAERYKYRSSNAGGSITIATAAPPSFSISGGQQVINNQFQSVVEQTGLFAGDGGFDIKVGGHTQLNGAAIASSATADKNRLATQTLDFTDLTNSEQTSVSGYSFGLSTAPGGTFITPVSNTGTKRSSVTQSLVSPGTVGVRNFNNQLTEKVVQFLSYYNQVQNLNQQLAALEPTKAAAIEAMFATDGALILYKQLQDMWATSTDPNAQTYINMFQQYIDERIAFLAPQYPALVQYNQVRGQLDLAEAGRAEKLDEIVALNVLVPTLQSRNLATANPALKNSFNASRTRAQLEAMNVFSETAMRIVGDVYKSYEKDVADAELEYLRAKADGIQTEIDAAKVKYEAAQLVWENKKNERLLAHGLVGGLTAALGGADPVSGTIGATAGKLVTTELDELLADSQWAKNNPVAANFLKALSATAAGSIVGGDIGGFVASQGDRFNRQLHPTEIDWIRRNAALYAALRGNGMTVAQAEAELTQQALKDVDLFWRSVLRDGNNLAAQAFLTTAQGSFLNELGLSQSLFTVENNQFLRPDQYLPEAISNMGFYQQNATRYAVRDVRDGLNKEVRDLSADAAKAITDDPIGVAKAIGTALWEAAKHPVDAVVDGFNVGGTTIGEGAAVALSEDLSNRLNALYGQDVASVQKTLVALSTAGAITGSLGAGKLVGAGAKGVKNLSGQAWAALAGDSYRQSRTNYKFTSEEVANGTYPEPAYASARMEFTTGTVETGYVRVYAEGVNNPEGAWFMRATDIQGLTPLQIQQKFALPTIPTHVVDVTVPQGFRMGAGIVAPNSYARAGGGGVQFQALDRYDSLSNPIQFGIRRQL